MTQDPRKAIQMLTQEIEEGVNLFLEDAEREMETTTPIDTGRARRGWRTTNKYQVGRSTAVIENRVPYIGVLDKGSSRQAPRGIVKPALDKLAKRK